MRYLLFIPLFAILLACSGNRDAIITGNLEDIENGTVILLSQADGEGELAVIASDTVAGNNFTINLGLIEKPVRLELTVAGSPLPGGMTVWAVPGKTVNISGAGQWPGAWMAVAETPKQEEWNSYFLPTSSFLTEQGKIYQRLEDIFSGGLPALEQRDARDEEIVELYDALDSIKMEISFVELEIIAGCDSITPFGVEKIKDAALNSYYGEYSHPEMAFRLRETALLQYLRMVSDLQQSPESYLINARLFPKEKISTGDFFEDSRFYDYEGRVDYIANYIGKGKYILIDCWFSQCSPCIHMIPEVNDVKNKFSDDLYVVGFNYWDDKARWLTGTEKYGINGINLWSSRGRQGFCEKYGLMANPVFVMIDPDGILMDVFYVPMNYGYLTQRVQELIDIPRLPSKPSAEKEVDN